MAGHAEGRRAARRWLGGVTALVVAVSLLAAPLADAKPGRSSSLGSRGSRTYAAPPVGKPIQRTITQPTPVSPAPPRPAYAPPPVQPGYAQPGYAQPGYQAGFGQRHPFLSGIAGGFLGASIAHSLFGGPSGSYGGGAGGAMGGLLRLLMMAGIAWLVWRLVRQALGFGQPATAPYEVYTPYPASVPPPAYGEGHPSGAFPPAGSAPASLPPVSIEMQGEDLQAFEQILQGVMGSWSRGDIAGLRRFVTPEILSYYGEELTENQSRGVANHVADVALVKGDVVESWREGERTYCSALLRWRARDWTVEEGSGRVVDGDDQRPREDQEVWTFVRADGGRWLLSAIQQT